MEGLVMNDTSYDIRTLNGLIATTLDSANGYRDAADNADSSRFTELFRSRAAERDQSVQTLRGEVTRLGGDPEEGGTLLAGAHRAWLDLKATITGNDDAAVVSTVESGEDHIKAKYEAALADRDVSAAVIAVIQTAFGSVREGHDQMRDLKHSLADS